MKVDICLSLMLHTTHGMTRIVLITRNIFGSLLSIISSLPIVWDMDQGLASHMFQPLCYDSNEITVESMRQQK